MSFTLVGKVAVVLLDGEDQDGDEEDGQGQGHHDIFGEFAHSFVFITNLRIRELIYSE